MYSTNFFDSLTKNYRLLCEIEYKVREIIDTTNTQKYGLAWINHVNPTINLNTASYLDLIFHISSNPIFNSVLNELEISKLFNLNQVRNKICHIRDLKYKEIELLNQCYDLIVSKTINNI